MRGPKPAIPSFFHDRPHSPYSECEARIDGDIFEAMPSSTNQLAQRGSAAAQAALPHIEEESPFHGDKGKVERQNIRVLQEPSRLRARFPLKEGPAEGQRKK